MNAERGTFVAAHSWSAAPLAPAQCCDMVSSRHAFRI